MKRILISFGPSAVFLLAIFIVSASPIHAQGVLKEILDRLDLYNRTLTSLQADVTMTKTDVQLGMSDVMKGTSSYLPKSGKRPVYMRLNWSTKPVEEIALIGDDYKLYKASTNQIFMGKVNKAKNSASVGNALAFMNMSREQLKANYDVQYLGDESIDNGSIRVWHINLTPKGTTSYKSAELWIDKDGMPRQGKVIEKNNDTTIVLLSNVHKNVTLDARVFVLNYPNAKVVKA